MPYVGNNVKLVAFCVVVTLDAQIDVGILDARISFQQSLDETSVKCDVSIAILVVVKSLDAAFGMQVVLGALGFKGGSYQTEFLVVENLAQFDAWSGNLSLDEVPSLR